MNLGIYIYHLSTQAKASTKTVFSLFSGQPEATSTNSQTEESKCSQDRSSFLLFRPPLPWKAATTRGSGTGMEAPGIPMALCVALGFMRFSQVLLFSKNFQQWVLEDRNPWGLWALCRLQLPWVKEKPLPASSGFIIFLLPEEFQMTEDMGWAVPPEVALVSSQQRLVVLPRCPTYSGKWKIMTATGK